MYLENQIHLTLRNFSTAANFLGYGNNLKVVRPITGLLNAVSTGSAVLIKNTTEYLNTYYSETGAGQNTSIGTWAAREAGTLGNSLKVSMCLTQLLLDHTQ